MAKTLKDFLEGYLKVKSADEQKFIDKHVTAKNPDRNGNGDDVFKGSTKPIDRRKERKGYNPGEDEKVYEELKGNQHKIDANKNGKVDAHDFKLLRKKKKVAEEAEQIDELSSDTLKSYRTKARAQGNKIVDKMKMGGGDWSKDQQDTKTLRKRSAGAQASGKQLVKRGESLKTEEAEQIDELSNDTLRSYRMKAKSIADHGGDTRAKGRELAGRKSYGGRMAGVEKAKVMAKEEAEQIDELSNKTLGSYVKKAKDQMSRSDTLAGRAMGAREHGAKPTAAERKHNERANKRYFGIDKAVDKMTKEEVEINEAHYALDVSGEYGNKAADDFVGHAKKAGIKAKVHTYNGPGGGNPVVHLSHADHKVVHKFLKKVYDPHMTSDQIERHRFNVKEEVELDEKLSAKTPMGTYIKDFQKSNAPQFKGKSAAKRRVMAIAAKLTAERGGKPLNKEERLQDRLADISESHQRVMLDVFEQLNEENKTKFMEACATPEGVDQMLDFAIRHRGE